ncbi:hypothetical protein YC2023_056877 [Brassica napus]
MQKKKDQICTSSTPDLDDDGCGGGGARRVWSGDVVAMEEKLGMIFSRRRILIPRWRLRLGLDSARKKES